MQVDSYGATAPGTVAAPQSAVATPFSPEVLTGRERDVLLLMARGLENQAIATELAIGYSTVRAHVDNTGDNLRPGMSFRIVLNLEGSRYPTVPEACGGERRRCMFLRVTTRRPRCRLPEPLPRRMTGPGQSAKPVRHFAG